MLLHQLLRPLLSMVDTLPPPQARALRVAFGQEEGLAVDPFVDLLGTPWRGVMMAGFAAAYMSTVGTQLNWGASYLVNDFYKRFVNKTGTEKHYVTIWMKEGMFQVNRGSTLSAKRQK